MFSCTRLSETDAVNGLLPSDEQLVMQQCNVARSAQQVGFAFTDFAKFNQLDTFKSPFQLRPTVRAQPPVQTCCWGIFAVSCWNLPGLGVVSYRVAGS